MTLPSPDCSLALRSALILILPRPSKTIENMASSSSPHTQQETEPEGLLKRSWHLVLQPFSSTALQSLPDTSRRNRDRETRADRIPEGEGDVLVNDYQTSAAGTSNLNGAQSEGGEATVNEDGTDAGVPVTVRVPKKIPTPIRVEGKVWFANERSKHLILLLHHRPLRNFKKKKCISCLNHASFLLQHG